MLTFPKSEVEQMNDCTVPKMKNWRDTNIFAPLSTECK